MESFAISTKNGIDPDQEDHRPEACATTKEAANRISQRVGQASRLSDTDIDGIALTRLPLITEAEYQKNPLAADVKFWGSWLFERLANRLGHLYPTEDNGGIPVAFLWARAIKCANPSCAFEIPLVRQWWVAKTPHKQVAVLATPDVAKQRFTYKVVSGTDIKFDPAIGTVRRGNAQCPKCEQVSPAQYVRAECKAGRRAEHLLAVAYKLPNTTGKRYRSPRTQDSDLVAGGEALVVSDALPTETISRNAPRRVSPPLYGFELYTDLFNPRQKALLTSAITLLREAISRLSELHDSEYARAIGAVLGCSLSKMTDFHSGLSRWANHMEKSVATFGRQAIPMLWDYGELNPFSGSTGSYDVLLKWTGKAMDKCYGIDRAAHVQRGLAQQMPVEAENADLVVTDPPYYDSVPYSDLSDWFYVWLKQALSDQFPALFRTPLTPKSGEITEQRPHSLLKTRRDATEYERLMGDAFSESHRVLQGNGLFAVMFAHKSTAAWESLIGALNNAGHVVTASWPLSTEKPGRQTSQGTASLASSITLVCRKRQSTAGGGYWDDVRDELRQVARERLDFFWQQGIRGADFFISAIGPALSVYGRYAKVTRLTGEEVSVGQFLDEVRRLVTDYALSQILFAHRRDACATQKDASASKKGKVGQPSRLSSSTIGQIDSETRFYVLWKWSYGDGKVAADEAFKLSQALGIDTEEMWDRTGVLEKQGQNVQALTVAKRMRIKDLGEPNVDGSPATLIDTLHRCCSFRDKGDTGGLSEYLARSGHGRNEKLWTVAQAISEVLPDGDKEKQLLQGLLNQRDKIDEALKQGELF